MSDTELTTDEKRELYADRGFLTTDPDRDRIHVKERATGKVTHAYVDSIGVVRVEDGETGPAFHEDRHELRDYDEPDA